MPLRHYVTGDCKVFFSFHFVLQSLTTITKAGNWVDFNFFRTCLVIHPDVPVIVNCLFSKWLLVVPLCMLSVAAQYKMHTERLITVSLLSGQIDSGTAWPWSTWKNGHWNRWEWASGCVVRHGCEWSYTVCADWSPVRFGFANDSHENDWLIRAIVTSRLKHNNGESYGEVFVI